MTAAAMLPRGVHDPSTVHPLRHAARVAPAFAPMRRAPLP